MTITSATVVKRSALIPQSIPNAEATITPTVDQFSLRRRGALRYSFSMKKSTKSAVPEKIPRQNNNVIRSTLIRRTKNPEVDQNTAANATEMMPQRWWPFHHSGRGSNPRVDPHLTDRGGAIAPAFSRGSFKLGFRANTSWREKIIHYVTISKSIKEATVGKPNHRRKRTRPSGQLCGNSGPARPEDGKCRL